MKGRNNVDYETERSVFSVLTELNAGSPPPPELFGVTTSGNKQKSDVESAGSQ